MDNTDNKLQQDLEEADIKVTIEETDADADEVDVHIIGIEDHSPSGMTAAYDFEDGSETVFFDVIEESDDGGADDDAIINE